VAEGGVAAEGTFRAAWDGLLLFASGRSPAPLPQHRHQHQHHRSLRDDCGMLGVAWGFLLAAGDFRQYLLYAVLCVAAGMNASATGVLYAAWVARGSVIALVWELLLSGWATDLMRLSQHRLALFLLPPIDALAFAAAALLAFASASATTTAAVQLVTAEVFYHLSTMAHTQATTSLWKVLKLRLSGGTSDREQAANSVVSAIGDVVAEVFEALLLALSALLAALRPVAMVGIVGSCMAVLLVLSVASCMRVLSTVQLVSPLDNTAYEGSPSPTPPLHQEHVTQKFRVPEWLRSVVSRPPLLHSFIHAQVGLLLYGLLGTPLVLALATNGKPAAKEAPEPGRSCSGMVTDLIAQGAVINVAFLFGAVLYSAAILRRPPRSYYGVVLLVVAGITMFALLMVPIVSVLVWEFPRMVVVSACQVVVYHLNTYDYSVMTACMPSCHYGRISSVYAAATHLLHLVNTFLLWSQAPLRIIVFLGALLLAVSALHGFWMRKLFIKSDWSHS